MKTRVLGRGSKGNVFIAVLIFVVIAATVTAVFLTHATRSLYLTRRGIDTEKAMIVAQRGVDYGALALRRLVLLRRFDIDQSLVNSRIGPPPPDPAGVYEYKTPSGALAFEVQVLNSSQVGIIPKGTGEAVNKYGRWQDFRVRVGVYNKRTRQGVVLTQTLQTTGIYLVRYGVFYVPDLEILPGPPMEFHGPVHANSDIYLGGPLQFFDTLSSHGNIYHERKNTGERQGETWIADSMGAMVSMLQDGEWIDSNYTNAPGWRVKSQELWGEKRVETIEHGVSELMLPIGENDEPHDIIEPAITDTNDPSYDAQTEDEKFENKAALTIHVASNGTITATDATGNTVSGIEETELKISYTNAQGRLVYDKDSDGQYTVVADGCLTLTSGTEFQDWREGDPRKVASVDVYVDQLLATYPDLTNGTIAVKDRVIYVERDAPDDEHLPALRIRNGKQLPQGGLTFASSGPVYIEGNYNLPHVTSNAVPALVAGDAVSILSRVWQDAASIKSSRDRKNDWGITASDTTVNTVIMTGNTESEIGTSDDPGDYNGGLENVLRFQEHWSGRTLTFRGSILCMWASEIANSPWHYGKYYTAPNRNWGYDQIYRTQVPPGMSEVFAVQQIKWERSRWADEGWN